MGWTKLLKNNYEIWEQTKQIEQRQVPTKDVEKTLSCLLLSETKQKKIANFLLSSWKNNDAEKYNTQYFQQM